MKKGHQRLSKERLDEWLSLGYGMFLHFGLATFSKETNIPYSNDPSQPIELYDPKHLDTDQWAQVARDAGMKYAILTAKHVTGFCLWPTKYSEHHAGNSRVKADVVGAFVESCRKYGIKPALYYTPSCKDHPDQFIGASAATMDQIIPYCTREFMDYVMGQVEELLTNYGDIEEIWFDGPHSFGAAGIHEVYNHCARLQPNCIIAMNSAWEDNGKHPVMKKRCWPSDVIVIENSVPPIWETDPMRKLNFGSRGEPLETPQDFYLPVEACGVVSESGRGWFWSEDTKPYKPECLLGIRILTKERNANCVLNVLPNQDGLISQTEVDALMRLKADMAKIYPNE